MGAVVNQALRTKESNLGFWVDPAGNIYDVGAYGHDEFARGTMLDDGVSFDIVNTVDDPEEWLLTTGWIQVSISGIWMYVRELAQGQIDALWEIAQKACGVDDEMFRRIMTAVQKQESVWQ